MNSGSDRLAVVALGSNLGSSIKLIQQALAELRSLSSTPLRTSSLWKTSPVDCPPGSPDFVNAVAVFDTDPSETPESLLNKLLGIESHLGRGTRTAVNAPRPIDLDLIAFGGERRETEPLHLPHPRAHLRRFVLAPLAEILPDFQAPGWPGTAAELLIQLPEGGEAARMRAD